MKKTAFLRKLLISLSFLALNMFSFARGKQELVKAGHWVYDAMTHVAVESGHVDLSDRAPLSVGELEFILDRIERDSLSESGRADYDRLRAYFGQKKFNLGIEYMRFGFEPEINLSGFYKTNDGIPWVYDRFKRKPLVLVPVSIEAKDFFTASMDVVAAQNRGTMIRNSVYSNVPLDVDDLDNSFPENGYFSTGYTFRDLIGANFNIGLGAKSFQRSLMGSVFYSEYFTGATNANLNIYTPGMRYLVSVSQFNVDKYMYSHQFDFIFFKKFQFSAMEALLVNAPMELRFLNPFTIFHGAAPWRDYDPDEQDPESNTSCYLALKFAWTPIRYLRLYGAGGFNQYQLAYERSRWKDDTTPNSVAAQLGLESFIPAGSGFFHVWIEGSYTDPYMYLKESPNWSLVRTYSENLGGKKIFYEWIGSPYGPDTIAGQLNFGYEKPGKWSAVVTWLFKASGEYSGTNIFDHTSWGGQKRSYDLNVYGSEWVYPVTKYHGEDEAKRRQKWVAPHGVVEYTNRVSLLATWKPTDSLTLMLQPAFVTSYNHRNVAHDFECGFEIAGLVSFRFCDAFCK